MVCVSGGCQLFHRKMRRVALRMPCDSHGNCLKTGAPEEIRTRDTQVRSTDLIRQLPLMTAASAAKSPCKSLFLLVGAPEEIRTPDS